jgi:hypothetical protein
MVSDRILLQGSLWDLSIINTVCVFYLDGRSTLGVRSVGSKEQGRQGTCNMWRIRVTMVPVETQQCVMCIVERNHCRQYTDECCTEMLLWGIYVASNSKTHLGLHEKCPKFLPDFNQIWEFLDKLL